MIWGLLLTLAGLAAVLDWWSVGSGRRDIERWAKPAVLVFLIATAALIPAEAGGLRWLIVAGLACGLVGDVLLFRDRFIPGASAFLAGHIAYIVAFALVPLGGEGLAFGAVLGAVAIIGPGRCVIRSAWARSHRLGVVVGVYTVVLLAMATLGLGTASPWIAAGVLLFAVSDLLLGWGRFVGSTPGGRVLVHVTYQLGQAGIVLGIPDLGG